MSFFLVFNLVHLITDIAIECFEKSRRGRPILPLQYQQGFQIIHNGGPKGVTSSRNRTSSPSRQASTNNSNSNPNPRSRSMSPVRRTRSLSPVKEAGGDSSKYGSRGVTGPQRAVPKATPLPSVSAMNPKSANMTASGSATVSQSAGNSAKEKTLTPNAKEKTLTPNAKEKTLTPIAAGQKPVLPSLQSQTPKVRSSGSGSRSPYENSSSVTLKMTHASQKKSTKGKVPATQANSPVAESAGKEKQNRGS